jgi:WD40 repeat protein
VDFSPDGKRLVTTEEREEMIVWDPSSGEKLLVVNSAVGGFFQVEYAPDGKSLITPMADGTVRVWDAESGEMLLTYAGHTGSVLHVAASSDGANLASAGTDGTVKMWETGLVGELNAFSLGPGASVFGRFAYSPDSRHVAIGDMAGPASVWDPLAGELVLTLPEVEEGAGSVVVAYSPDGTLLAVSAGNGAIHIWDLESRQVVQTLTGHEGLVVELAFSPDGRRLASAGFDGLGAVWDLESGQALRLTQDEQFLFGIAFSPDGSQVATTSPMIETDPEERGIHVWDAATGTELYTLAITDTLSVYVVRYSPDGELIAAGIQEGHVLVWETSTGELAWRLTGHTGLVAGVDFGPEGKLLTSSSKDNTVKVWDMDAGKELATLYGQTGGLGGHAFSPDGMHIATTDGDGTVFVYVVNIEDLIDLARSRVTRSLTTQECQKYLHVDECPERP